MIDTSEHLLPLSEAARTLPGGEVHVSTLHRWRLRGVCGIRLETILRGGVRYTSSQAIERFFAATTAAASGEQLTIHTSRQRERAQQQAKAELDAAGL
jgi:hypothetical protein